MSQKIFDNNLVEICENKVRLKLNKPAYTRMYMFRFKSSIDVQTPS